MKKITKIFLLILIIYILSFVVNFFAYSKYLGNKELDTSNISIIEENYLDTNVYLDDIIVDNSSQKYVSFDLYVNGNLVNSSQYDIYYRYKKGSTFEIKNFKFKEGYRFKDDTITSITGTIGEDNFIVNLYIIPKTIQTTFFRNISATDTTSSTQEFTYAKSNQSFKTTGFETQKKGYTMLGWSRTKEATTNEYGILSNVTDSWINTFYPKVNLYAIWKLNTYNIGYTLNSGSNPGNPSTYTVETNTITLKNPTRTGYTFAGWTGSNGNTKQTTVTIPKGSTGDKSYSANWDLVTYSIGYTLNGGSNPGNPTSYNITSNNFTLKNPTKTGYTFTGWTGTGLSSATKSVTVAKGSTGNRSYTANWNKDTYTITYNLNSGSLSGQKTTYQVDTANFTLPTPTRTGYTFAGWTGTGLSSATKSVTVAKGSTGNRSYTANWTINKYTVDVNSIIDGTTYGTGKSGFTFDVYLNGTLNADNVTDWCQQVNYGTKVRVVANNVSGYARENADVTQTIGTSNITFYPKWFKYTPISLRFYNTSVPNGSYSFNTSTGIYTVTQNAGSSGWGDGSLCDNTGIKTAWGKTYVLHFEIKVPKSAKLYLDPNMADSINTQYTNDWFKSCVYEIDGSQKTYNNNVASTVANGKTYYWLPGKSISTTLSADKWYSINLYTTNNASWNTSQLSLMNYTGFGFDLGSSSSNLTYQVRNIYSYNK